jgi:hypothetical protein
MDANNEKTAKREFMTMDSKGRLFRIREQIRSGKSGLVEFSFVEYRSTEGDQVILFKNCFLVKRGDDVFETYPYAVQIDTATSTSSLSKYETL